MPPLESLEARSIMSLPTIHSLFGSRSPFHIENWVLLTWSGSSLLLVAARKHASHACVMCVRVDPQPQPPAYWKRLCLTRLPRSCPSFDLCRFSCVERLCPRILPPSLRSLRGYGRSARRTARRHFNLQASMISASCPRILPPRLREGR